MHNSNEPFRAARAGAAVGVRAGGSRAERRLGRCLLLALVALSAGPIDAQDARFHVERVATRQGVLRAAVYCATQDRFGFLWLGTSDGLMRYDGNEIQAFRYDPFSTTALIDLRVNAVAEDSAGYLWAGTDRGLSRLDRTTGRFTRFVHDDRSAFSLASDFVRSIVVDSEGFVWIGLVKGIDRYDPRTGRFAHFFQSGETGLRPTPYLDRRGRVWVCAWHESPLRATIGLFEARAARFRVWPLAAGRAPEVIGEDHDGRLYIGLHDSYMTDGVWLSRFDPATGIVVPFEVPTEHDADQLSDNRVALRVDPNGDCWFAVLSRIGSIRGPDLNFSVYCEPSVPKADVADTVSPTHQPLVSGNPHVVLRDRAGTTWIGLDDGMVRISRIGAGFTTWRHDPTEPSSLSASRIRSIQVDRHGVLWAGTEVGLNRYDPATNTWRHFLSDRFAPGSLPNSTINVIYEDHDGTLLIGTNGGLSSYDAASGRFRNPFPRASELMVHKAMIWSLLRDRHGDLWVGTTGSGLARFDAQGRELEWLTHDDRPGSLSGGGVWCLLEDRSGTIWAGTNEGLCRWMPATRSFRRYVHRSNDPRSLAGDHVWALHEDSRGELWVSTFGGGVSHYDPRSDDFTSTTTRDGLPSNGVFGLLEDAAGVFWISTQQGLVRWDRRARTMRLFGEGDGLQGDMFSFKAFTKAPDGTLYFGGVDGLSAFKPELLRTNPNVPPIVVTGFRVYDSLVANELGDGDTVRLDYTQNFFSFEFAALDYLNPGRNRYAYKLDGVDRDWVMTGSDHRVASYTDLDPGTYLFRVRGSNNDGVWNDQGVGVMVIIAPPWWLRLPVRIGAGLLAVLAIVGTLRWRIERVRRNERRKSLEQEATMRAALASQEVERSRIARDLHDGVGQTLAAARINIIRFGEMMERRLTAAHDDGGGDSELRVPLERAIAIVDRAGADVRAISHALGTSTVHELGLVEGLAELMTTIEAHDQTRFTLSSVALEERLPIGLETGLFRVAQELITNVLHHARASEATVQIVRDRDEIRLTVEDNGVGFGAADVSAGMGRQNIAARVAAMHGSVLYDSTPGHGTTVTVVVPTPDE